MIEKSRSSPAYCSLPWGLNFGYLLPKNSVSKPFFMLGKSFDNVKA